MIHVQVKLNDNAFGSYCYLCPFPSFWTMLLQILQIFEGYMICFSRFVVLDFQFLSWKPLNSRRKDDIVIANVVSTLNWITPVQWMETLIAQYHGQTILSVFVRKTFTVWVGTISFAACHASSFTFQNKISLFAVRVKNSGWSPSCLNRLLL